MSSNTDSSVRVVVRIRPQMTSEKIDMCEVCTRVLPDLNQISLGEGRSFTFDSVCDLDSNQVKVYELCALDLIKGLFEGYNATIIAYGQTGSGKTYTMGTSFDLTLDPSLVGIIPRAMDQLFSTIDEIRRSNDEEGLPRPEFSVSAQFMELYNEEIFDLLSPANDKTKKSGIKIHEDGNSNICVVGLNSYKIASKDDAMECLKVGTLSRSTASTNMNVQSSRSHAIFSIFLQQKRYTRVKKTKDEDNDNQSNSESNNDVSNNGHDHGGDDDDDNGEVMVEVLNAKFNFVDLAGSERLKRTGATGDRAKEGISINCGLLALGNVISALGDLAKIGCHVPYRDSKLTRILQDSLGGNSRTTMIACISPSDRDFMETLNTLKYANRARNIRNKVSVNKDMSRDQLIQSLRAEVASLRKQLQAFKGGNFEDPAHNDMLAENRMLLSENRDLHGKVKAMSLTIDDVTARNVKLRLERDAAAMVREAGEDVNLDDERFQNLMKSYIEEAETYRSKLVTAERHLANLSNIAPMTHRSNDAMSRSMTCYPSSDQSLAFLNRSNDVIQQAKLDVENLTKIKYERERSVSRIRSRSERRSENETTFETPGGCYDDLVVTCDEDDDDDDASMGEGSETEIENAEDLEGNLAELSCEISIKQKLIDELIESQKRMRMLRQQYEEKISNLEEKIKVTEQERDHVFQGIGSDKKGSKEDTKRLKKDYEDRLNEMKERLLKLNAAKKEHKKLMVNQGNYERRLNNLQGEMAELKRIKVKLMRQLEEESHRRQQSEQRMKKEMATMQKLQRTKDVQLKNLEVERKKKDVVLKRKIQEVEALKKKEKFLNDKRLAAQKMRARRDKKALPWDRIEKMIEASVSKKQALKHLDRDMEKWMEQREHLCRKLDHLTERLRQAESKKEDVAGLVSEIDGIRTRMNATQDSIHRCQKCIITFEENKDDDLESLISNCSMGDILYFLERCTSMVINKGMMVAQKDEELKELQAQLDQEKQENQLNLDAMERLIGDKVDVEVKHGVIVSVEDDMQDRSPTPPLIMIDSLEDLEDYQERINGSSVLDREINTGTNAIAGRQSDVQIGEEALDVFGEADEELGTINTSDSTYSTPTPKLHLIHTKTATSHTKAVLSLHFARDKLFSSGKDASVKVWDLERCAVVTSYVDNPGSVVKVRHVECLGLTFAASTYVVKVWDARSKGCVAILTSSGSTINQSQLTSGSLVSCPPGETNINNIASNQSGSLFFSAAGNSVRIWDSRMFKPISKLHGGHQCPITAMTLTDINQSTALVATGSKDNTIRIYNISNKELSSGSPIHAKISLNPCHSDNIESLCFNGSNHLYSGARDMTISKWDLSGGGQHRQTIQNAHRSWISSLCHAETNLQINSSSSSSSPSTGGWLLSGCQAGTLRLWSSPNLTLLSEYRSAHQGAINAVVVGGFNELVGGLQNGQKKFQQQFVFTGSNDKTINIWRAKNSDDK